MATSSSVIVATLLLALVLCVSVARAQNFLCVTCNSSLTTPTFNQTWCLDPYIPPSSGANYTTGTLCYKAVYAVTLATGTQMVVARGSLNSGLGSTIGINTGCVSSTTLAGTIASGMACGCRGDYCNAATVHAPSSMITTFAAAAAGVFFLVAARRLH